MELLPLTTSVEGTSLFKPRGYQEESIRLGVEFLNSDKGPNELQVLPTGCHAKGAEILMYDLSTKLVEDIVVGDRLKCPTTWESKEVLQLCRGREQMYRVRYGEGPKFHDVNGSHFLHVRHWGINEGDDKTYDLTVEDFIQMSDEWKSGKRLVMQPSLWSTINFPFSITPLEDDFYYGFTLDGDHLYMTSDFIVHHNSGKSVCIGNICDRVYMPLLVLQPSKEILEQNYSKFISYGGHAGMFCASVGRKDLSRVTFASIQSIMSRGANGKYLSAHHFMHFRHVIIDEADIATNVKGTRMDAAAVKKEMEKDAQIADFLHMLSEKHVKPPRVLGFTATPFRLFPCNDRYGNKDMMLKFLTRTRPALFGKLAYHVQIKELAEQGFLAPAKYYSVVDQLSHGFDRTQLKVNSTGADYDENALQEYYDTIDFKTDIVKIIQRINKTGRQVLVFMSSVADAEWVSSQLPDSATVTGKTPTKKRKATELAFKDGTLRSVVNCGVFMVGFDMPQLKVVLLARPLRSLAKYYQAFGRSLRPYNDETAWLIDACKNLSVFGRIEDLRVDFDIKGLPVITGTNGKLLTGVPLKEQEVEMAQEVMY